MELKDNRKRVNITPRSVFQTIKNSINGIISYAHDGKSIFIYLFGVIVETLMGFVYHINGLEWILIICLLGIILAVELLNTALESACDAITLEYNSFIKIAKDCGSAATFIIFFMGILLNIIIFYPKVVALFS